MATYRGNGRKLALGKQGFGHVTAKTGDGRKFAALSAYGCHHADFFVAVYFANRPNNWNQIGIRR